MADELVELPIDHFRLLGVSPSAEDQSVLRALQLRLDRSPQEGFTHEALVQRAELLKLSADLLTDKQLREKYESALLGGAVGLEVSSNREVAGIILLWEADSSSEAFQLACKALRPPQTPALGSGREADLTLVAALSCKAAAIQEQEQRRYEAASQLLSDGLKLLQRMGKLPEQRESIEKDLEALLPYRILDLVSRDLGDQSSHLKGIALLDSFVRQRGGIEGRKLNKSSSGLNQQEFEVFFQQIRKFLTVQEQADLFINWQKGGSTDAAFLGVLALTAAGFSRRKPERIQEARRQLKALNNLQGLDSMPLLGCMDLLLANVEKAKEKFMQSPDEGLNDWLVNYPGDPLAALCDYCRDWLRKDVLPGYRDVDAEAVDLEAWFADRDVQSFIERSEWKGARDFAKASFAFLSPFSEDQTEQSSPSKQLDGNETVPNNPEEAPDEELAENISSEETNDSLPGKNISIKVFVDDYLVKLSKIKFITKKLYASKKGSWIILALITASLGLLGANTFFNSRTKTSTEIEPENVSNQKVLSDIISEEEQINQEEDQSPVNLDLLSIEDLTVKEPSKEQITKLLQAWLSNKAAILSGKEGDFLLNMAKGPLAKRVQLERKKDISAGEIQQINATIKSLKLVSQTPKRIEVQAKIAYEDKRMNTSGETISETTIPGLKVTYILGREKELWQLVDYISGN